MSSVLFDTPGPRARRRHLVISLVTGALLLGLLVLVVRRLVADEFSPDNVEALFQANNMNALAEGLVQTLQAAGISIVTSVTFGLVFATARLSDRRFVRGAAWVVVEFFRAVPLLMLILFIFLSYNDLVGGLGALVIGLTLYNGSVLAEVFRAGINAVPQGQSEAAYGIGLRKLQVMRLVLIPQAVRIMLPAIISQCVVILKDTSLGFVIIYTELVWQGRLVAQFIGAGLLTYTLLAMIFIAINYSLSRLAVWLERRLGRATQSAAEQVEGVTSSAAG